MSRNILGNKTRSTVKAKVELRRALPVYIDGDAFVVDGAKRSGAVALVVRVSAAFLAQSRRVGSIDHAIGVFDLEDNMLGIIELRGEDAIHYVLFDPAERFMRNIIEEGERSGCLLKVFLTTEGDVQLSTVADEDMMCEVIRNAARHTRCDTRHFAAAHLALAEQLRRTLAQCALAEVDAPNVVLHSFLTDERFMEAEHLAAGDASDVVVH